MSSGEGEGADGARGSDAADTCDTCDSCGQSSMKTKRCSGCKTTRYCDAACQKSHWPVHRRMCRQIQDESKARRRELGEALLEASGRGQLSEVRGLLAAGLTRLMSDTEDGHKSSYKTTIGIMGVGVQ